MGKILIIAGLILVGLGVLVQFGINFSWFGKLPGDISIKGENYAFYFPITSGLLVSIVLSAVLYFVRK